MRHLSLIALVFVMAFSVQAAAQTKVRPVVVKEYNHDRSSYTQGLFFHGGKLYESTGLYGKSTFREVELSSGKALFKLNFASKYFVEGSVILDDFLYILTWTNKILFIYDAKNLKYLKTVSYPREGWGITTDGKQLIVSDGSSKLYFLDKELKVKKTINVTLNGRSINNLNELEWIDGEIWANVYTTDYIVVINPLSGNIDKIIDCSGLLPEKLKTPSTDVLNGIAKDPKTGKIYVTGKCWPRLFEITLP